MAVLIAFSSVALASQAAATEINAVKITGRYYQAQARALMNSMNNLRTGVNSSDNNPTAWAWDNEGYMVFYHGLQKFTYDYDLEKIAMQRAAELAVYYAADHSRADGTSWETAHTVYNPSTGVSIGENIFAASSSTAVKSATAAFENWLEENEPYEGQGHRRNMLSIGYPFTATAVACFEVDENFFWVALFRSTNISNVKTTVGTEYREVEVNLNSNFVKNFDWDEKQTDLTMHIGQSMSLWPQALVSSTSYELENGEILYFPTKMDVSPVLKSSDPTILTVAGNTLTAKGAGNCSVTATAFGKSITFRVYIDKIDLSSAVITLTQPQDTFIYTGSTIMPDISAVTLDGVRLRGVVDYDVTYGENTAIGTGVIAISGVGNYRGAVSKSFKIIDAASCTHYVIVDPAIDGNCVMSGKTAGSHCGICGKVFVKQKDTGMGTHVEVVTGAAAATCTTDGATGTVRCAVCQTLLRSSSTIPALGHAYPASVKVTKATTAKNGSLKYVCTRCGDAPASKNKVVYYPKTYSLSKTAFTYKGKVQKPKLVIKDAAGKTIGTSHYSVSIPNGKNVGRYKITVKFKGTYYSGSKILYYDILPKNTAKLTLGSAKKAFKAKWTTQKVQTNGYQIQYSLYSNFKSAKTYTLKSPKYTAATISKLTANKKYYVRIRTYRTVKYNGKNINLYSTWYKTLSVKTKK